MESASNGHHNHLQDHLFVSSSDSSSSCYGVGTTPHAWSTTSYPLLNNTNGFPVEDLGSSNSRELPSMAPDLGFHWEDAFTSKYDFYNEMARSSHVMHHPELGTELFLRPFSSDHLVNKIQLTAADQTSSFDNMNLEALDLLASSRFSQLQAGIPVNGFPYDFGCVTTSNQAPSLSTSDKASASRNGESPTPKPSNSKKPRLETRPWCPPLKVRKEKLGDRIAALQQLVSPFGKTDTASVLMEAIGYIKFLQNQVETLSVPYMKGSRARSVSSVMKQMVQEKQNEESKRDLRSRGLCLVPVSCLSYIGDGGGAAVWPPAYYGGAM